MSIWGIKMVWAGWSNDEVIGFSHQAYERWKDDLPPGTRMLIYETTNVRPGSKAKGAKAIVGEIEVIGTFADGEAYQSPTEQHSNLLPVRVIRRRETITPIPLETVRLVLADKKFPLQGEAWRPIFQNAYHSLLKRWE